MVAKMIRNWYLWGGFAVSLLLLNSAMADEEIDNMLTAEQRALQADIEHSMVAPCCWNMTLDQHDSGVARKVRQEIAEMVKAGKSKEEILASFVAQPQYGERILATPSQKTWLGKAAYWLIPVAIMFGAVVVTVTIKSLSKADPEKTISKRKVKSAKKSDSDDEYESRVEQDLKDFEA